MAWNLACPDWEQRLREGRSLVPELPLITAEAERAVAVFNKLRLADVPGNPTMAEAAGDWFRDIVRAIFGSYDPATRIRFIQELLLLVPKKNSKTTNGSLLMLTALLLNKRPKAKFILTGPTQDIAELAYAQAVGAIELDETLKKLLYPRDHLKTIEHRKSGAMLDIMTFDPSVLTGQKPAGILIDELHVCAKMAKASSAIRQLRGGMMAYPEAFMAFITTQSEEAPVGVYRSELNTARAIRDGKRQGALLPVLYEFPEAIQRNTAAWQDPQNWPMVTPNLGRSIDIDRLTRAFTAARDKGDDELKGWASQHLNLEIGLSLGSDAWAGAEYWEDQGDPALTLDELLRRCDVVVVGVDGGGLDDLLGLAVLGRCRETRDWLHWGRAWAHPIVLKRRMSEASRLQDFAAEGDLRLVDRIGQDIAELVEIIVRVRDAGLLPDKHGIGLDPAGIGAVLDALAEVGIEGDMVAAVSQGWRMGGAIKTAERKLAEGGLWHGGRPLMAWSVGNAKVEQRANSIMITKQASGTAKIDPLMALFNAAHLMSLQPAARAPAGVVFL